MKTTGKIKIKRNNMGISDKAFNMFVTIFVTIWAIIVLYPLIYVVSSSLSSGDAITSGKVLLFPVEFSLKGYEMVFQNKQVWVGYANTIFYSVMCTLINLVYTIMISYVLARKNFQGRAIVTTLYLITMWFSGGMIPKYVLVSGLGMVNSRWGYILMTGMSVSNMVVMRTYFQSSIPGDMLEAAKVDGCTDIRYLLKIAIPLAKPVIAVITLYYLVGNWNSYMDPLIYLRKAELKPLPLILHSMLGDAAKIDASQMMSATAAAEVANVADTMKYALIVISTVPMLILYPCVQKFFDKGVMMGSLKG